MSLQPQFDSQLEQLGRTSRQSVLLSTLGFFLILAAIGYAVYQLRTIERQRTDLLNQVQDLRSQLGVAQEQLKKARWELEDSLRQTIATMDAKVALIAFHAGHYQEAVSLCDKALAADPDNAYVQDLRAYFLFKLRRIPEAIAGEQRAISGDPNYPWSYLNLARAQCAASPPLLDDARKSVVEAIRLDPQIAQFIKQDGEFQTVCKGQIP